MAKKAQKIEEMFINQEGLPPGTWEDGRGKRFGLVFRVDKTLEEVDLELALKYFAELAADRNVPVGIIVTGSGRFIVSYSRGWGNKAHETIILALNEILEQYKQHKNA